MLFSSLASFAAVGLVLCGMFSFVAQFPPKYMRTFISGQSLSCILSAILSIFCQAFTSNNINDGRLFFFITIIWAIISICLFCYLANSKELKTFILKDSDDTNRIASIDSQDGESDQVNLIGYEPDGDDFSRNVLSICSDVKYELISISLIFFVTCIVFPSITSLARSYSRNGIWKDYFTSISFLLFNCSDAIGRLLSSAVNLNAKTLIVVSTLRLIFVPLICFCNVQPRYHSTTIFNSDLLYISFIISFSFTNGLFLSSAIVSATMPGSFKLLAFNKDLT
ncbi:unnamed protein product [Dracunculus medinensis]|uniref:Equilibrative nucleoside transporter n=1 Tax=Dracunculus medinensis TaxID=318479 RepID=A0A158Q3Q1_DRAME|nr:unnamed protein product [Dracunculus medinensis]